jgi:hypothetical protein
MHKPSGGRRSLRLSLESVRVLRAGDLAVVGGGSRYPLVNAPKASGNIGHFCPLVSGGCDTD